MCKFQITESKANAHAGMPFCGMLQFVMPTFLVGLWSYRPRATARLGGWVVCVYRLLGMHSLTWINATICSFFVFSRKLAKFFVEQGQTP